MTNAEYERERDKLSLLAVKIIEVLEGPCAARCMDDNRDRIETAKAIAGRLDGSIYKARPNY